MDSRFKPLLPLFILHSLSFIGFGLSGEGPELPLISLVICLCVFVYFSLCVCVCLCQPAESPRRQWPLLPKSYNIIIPFNALNKKTGHYLQTGSKQWAQWLVLPWLDLFSVISSKPDLISSWKLRPRMREADLCRHLWQSFTKRRYWTVWAWEREERNMVRDGDENRKT